MLRNAKAETRHIITETRIAKAKTTWAVGIKTDTVVGMIGSGMAIGIPFMEFLTHTFQFFGAGAGLVLLYFSIRHKILEIKKLKDGNTK